MSRQSAERGLPLPGQKRYAHGSLALGALFPAYLPEVQQHLQGANAQGDPACLPSHLLLQHGEIRHESKDPAIFDGTFRYWSDDEHLYPHQL